MICKVVAAESIKVNDYVNYRGYSCKIIQIYLSNFPEIGFTFLKDGDTDPKMFHVTAGRYDKFNVSINGILRRL